MTDADDYPHVSVVIATRDRPELLRRALAGVLHPDYPGVVDATVVFDQSEPDHAIEQSDPLRRVRVMRNERTPGLAGARNTGILGASGQLVAFCDDDDEWLPGKLRHQVDALQSHSDAHVAATGITIRYRDTDTDRVPDPQRLTHAGFLADRMTEVHPSSFLAERAWLLEEVGLVDEDLPGSYAEDYDLLLRVSERGPIAVTPRPLVRIWWHGASFFFERWKTIDEALTYLLAKHPGFAASARGTARILGQQAVARAAMNDRRQALRTALAALRRNPLEKRAYLAAVVAGTPLTAERALAVAHRFGKGI